AGRRQQSLHDPGCAAEQRAQTARHQEHRHQRRRAPGHQTVQCALAAARSPDERPATHPPMNSEMMLTTRNQIASPIPRFRAVVESDIGLTTVAPMEIPSTLRTISITIATTNPAKIAAHEIRLTSDVLVLIGAS